MKTMTSVMMKNITSRTGEEYYKMEDDDHRLLDSEKHR